MPFGQLGLPKDFSSWMQTMGYGGGATGMLAQSDISTDPEYAGGLQRILQTGRAAFEDIPMGLGGLQEKRRMGGIGLQREAVGAGAAARGALGRSGFAGAGAITAGLTHGRREREQRFGGILAGYKTSARENISSELERIFSAMGIGDYISDLLSRGAAPYTGEDPETPPSSTGGPGMGLGAGEIQSMPWEDWLGWRGYSAEEFMRMSEGQQAALRGAFQTYERNWEGGF